MSLHDEPRRLKLIYLTPEALLDLFNSCRFRRKKFLGESAFWAVPTSNLPPDAQAVGVNYDYRRNAFAVTLEHPSFDPVESCHEIPEFEIQVNLTHIPVRSPK